MLGRAFDTTIVFKLGVEVENTNGGVKAEYHVRNATK